MFTSENRVGNLVELRVASPFSEKEIAQLIQTHLEVLRGTSVPYTIVVDMRGAQVFPASITERFIGLMSVVNPDLLRSAVLVNESAILGLQAERAIAESGNPNRRAFRDPEALRDWMAEVLSTEELFRLRGFLIEGEMVLED